MTRKKKYYRPNCAQIYHSDNQLKDTKGSVTILISYKRNTHRHSEKKDPTNGMKKEKPKENKLKSFSRLLLKRVPLQNDRILMSFTTPNWS